MLAGDWEVSLKLPGGSQVWAVNAHAAQRPMLRPWTGYAVLCGYAAAAALAGLILLRTRDA